jgi:DNA polymerase/3'-5' exonuclease PolX
MLHMTVAQLASCFRTEADRIATLNEQSAPYRARNYRLAADKIESQHSSIMRVTQAIIERSGLTPFMQNKAAEYMNATNGHNESINTKEKKKEDKHNKQTKDKGRGTDIIAKFAEISGIGPKKAAIFYQKGHRTIADLLADEQLPIEARMFLELKPVTRIPRHVIQEIDRRIQACTAQYNHTHAKQPVQMLITGSYRRQRPFSSDVDICYTAKQSQGIDLALLILRQCFGVENLRVYSQGPDKCSMILIGKINVKLDIWHVTPENSAAMILYSTGSKEHNILMRQRAKKLGLLLNQEGLFRDGKRLPLLTEREYFEALQMKYKEPHER